MAFALVSPRVGQLQTAGSEVGDVACRQPATTSTRHRCDLAVNNAHRAADLSARTHDFSIEQGRALVEVEHTLGKPARYESIETVLEIVSPTTLRQDPDPVPDFRYRHRGDVQERGWLMVHPSHHRGLRSAPHQLRYHVGIDQGLEPCARVGVAPVRAVQDPLREPARTTVLRSHRYAPVLRPPA